MTTLIFGNKTSATRQSARQDVALLIGRIGNGQPFFVGTGMQSFRAGTTGRLYLGVNDDYVQDNSGSFRVMISR